MGAVGTIAFPVCDYSYHGRNLTALGEDGDMGFMAEGHGIGALRAINAWQRELLGPCWHTREFGGDLKAEEVWVVIVTSCGCNLEQHRLHVDRGHRFGESRPDCDCKHLGLPPCRDDADWNYEYATAETPGAIAATEVRL